MSGEMGPEEGHRTCALCFQGFSSAGASSWPEGARSRELLLVWVFGRVPISEVPGPCRVKRWLYLRLSSPATFPYLNIALWLSAKG